MNEYFIKLVAEMREAQKEHTKAKTVETQNRARVLEKQVDSLSVELLAPITVTVECNFKVKK